MHRDERGSVGEGAGLEQVHINHGGAAAAFVGAFPEDPHDQHDESERKRRPEPSRSARFHERQHHKQHGQSEQDDADGVDVGLSAAPRNLNTIRLNTRRLIRCRNRLPRARREPFLRHEDRESRDRNVDEDRGAPTPFRAEDLNEQATQDRADRNRDTHHGTEKAERAATLRSAKELLDQADDLRAQSART